MTIYYACLLYGLFAFVSPASAQPVLFDFNNAPAYTSLPINLTVGGITARFSATGQGFSIQNANVLGFTPVGFSGNCIYPNSIYLADLHVGFDHILSHFNIMYSCQELGCDDAATMRVTAFKSGIYVGTATHTASMPGTWPVDTLGCTFTQGFDSVVVHYDSHPPTCQDYGVIYMADNMWVTVFGCTLPTVPGAITTTGGIAKVCPGDTRTYTTTNATGVTWNWSVPAGAVINSGQGTRSINVTYNSGFTANGVLSVAKVNACGQGPARSLTIARNVPATPGPISGIFTGLCGASNMAYSVTPIGGMTYNWTTPLAATITSGQTTNVITVDYPSSAFSGYIAVTANNECGASAQSKKAVNGLPAVPAVIHGPACVFANSSGNAFYIAPIASAVNYTWTGPTGSHITASGITSLKNVLTTADTAVTVSFTTLSVSSAIKVKANNSCGSGTTKTLLLSICPPPAQLRSSRELGTLLYPNPVFDLFTLKFYVENAGDCEVIIEDLTGRPLLKQTITISAGWNEAEFNIHEFDNGVYFLHLKTGFDEQVMRILKE